MNSTRNIIFTTRDQVHVDCEGSTSIAKMVLVTGTYHGMPVIQVRYMSAPDTVYLYTLVDFQTAWDALHSDDSLGRVARAIKAQAVAVTKITEDTVERLVELPEDLLV